MGRGTNTNIFRRIAKNYLQRLLPEEAAELSEVNTELIRCWRDNGQHSVKCKGLEDKLVSCREQNSAFMKHIHSLKLLQQVTSQIEAPEYQRDKKSIRQHARGGTPWYPFEFKK
jgi:hypothetical protein